MRPQDFPGVWFPLKNYKTVLDEIAGISTTVGGEQKIWGTRIDQLRNRVDVGTGPDVVVSFVGAAGPVLVPHNLVDAAGNPVQPRYLQLVSWANLAAFDMSADSKNVTVNATLAGTGKIAVYA